MCDENFDGKKKFLTGPQWSQISKIFLTIWEKFLPRPSKILTNFDGPEIFLTGPSKNWKSSFFFWPWLSKATAVNYFKRPPAPRASSSSAKANAFWLWAWRRPWPLFLFLHKSGSQAHLSICRNPNISLNLSGATRHCWCCWLAHSLTGMHASSFLQFLFNPIFF